MAAVGTYISRVNQPLVRPLVAPTGRGSSADVTAEAEARRNFTYSVGSKISSSSAIKSFSFLPINAIFIARVTASGDHSLKSYSMQSSLAYVCDEWRMMLAPHGLDVLFGTVVEPNYPFTGIGTSIATTLAQRNQCNKEFYNFLKQMTAGVAHDIVVATDQDDGIAALRNLRIQFHQRITKRRSTRYK